MPLPGQGTLSLHGYSRIGDTTTTEPKKGMIIRMTTETLEALQDSLGQANLEVQMSDSPVRASLRQNILTSISFL